MRQKKRDLQSLILKPLSPDHEHGLSVSTNSKTRKGRNIPTAPLFFYNDFAAHFSAKTGLPGLFRHRSRDDHPQREPPHFLHIEQQGIDDKYRVQDQYRPADIREEAGHLDAILFCDRLDHEIRGVADIRIGPHEDSACGDRFQHERSDRADGGRDAFGRAKARRSLQENKVGRGIIQTGGQESAHPEHMPRPIDTKLCAMDFEKHERRDHGDKDADKHRSSAPWKKHSPCGYDRA